MGLRAPKLSNIVQTGPPPNSEFTIVGFQRFKCRGNPNGQVQGNIGDECIDLDSGTTYNKLADDGFKTGWAAESIGSSLASFDGSDPTGTTDSTAAFVEALASIPDGDTLHLTDGAIFLVGPLTTTRTGPIRIFGNATIKCASNTPNWLTINASNVIFDGVTFDGDNKTCNMLKMSPTNTDWALRRCIFKNAQANDAILGPGVTGQANGFLFGRGNQRVIVSDCTFEDITYSGGSSRFCAAIYGVAPAPSVLADHFYDVRITGCRFYRIGNGTSTNSDALRFQGYSTSIHNTGVIVNDNTFIGCGNRAAKFLISGFEFCDNWIESTEVNSVTGTIMFSGVSAYGGNGIISGNVFTGGIYRAIDVASNILGRVEHVTVSDNVIELEPVYGLANSEGIYLSSVLSVTCSNNLIKSAKFGIVVDGDSRRVQINSTDLEDVQINGIYFTIGPSGGTTSEWDGLFPSHCSVNGVNGKNVPNLVWGSDGCLDINVAHLIGENISTYYNLATTVTGFRSGYDGDTGPIEARSTDPAFRFKITASPTDPQILLQGPGLNTHARYDGDGTIQQWTWGRAGGSFVVNGRLVWTRTQVNLGVITYAGVVPLDLSAMNDFQSLTLAGDITFTAGLTYSPGLRKEISITADGSLRNITWPAGWTWLGTAPTTLAANKTGMVRLRCTGTTAASLLASWEVQP